MKLINKFVFNSKKVDETIKIQCNAFRQTTFFVLNSGVQLHKWLSYLLTFLLVNMQHSCPCAKCENSKLFPQTSNDYPCDLLMVIVNAICMGNCSRLKSSGKSVDIIGIRGFNAFSPLHFALMIVAWMTFINFFTVSFVPLYSRG